MGGLNKAEGGIAHIAAVVLIGAVLVIGLVGWRVSQSSNNSSNSDTGSSNQSSSKPSAQEQSSAAEQSNAAEADIALQNFGLASLDSVDFNQQAVREYDSMGLKGFYVFGDKLGGKTDARFNPNFEFSSLKAGTKLVSAIDGVVAFIKEQPDTKDYEVFIQPKNKSAWTVGYDHVSNVTVKKDAIIKAGDVIGEPTAQGNGLYRFEIQINKDLDGATTHYCPSTLLSETAKNSLLTALESMQQKWVQTTGIASLYDVTAQQPIGCLKATMTPQEAEGR